MLLSSSTNVLHSPKKLSVHLQKKVLWENSKFLRQTQNFCEWMQSFLRNAKFRKRMQKYWKKKIVLYFFHHHVAYLGAR